MNELSVMWTLPPAILIAGIALGYGIRKLLYRTQMASDQKHTKNALLQAREDADRIRTEGNLSARNEILCAREALDQESQLRRQTLDTLETHVAQREKNLDLRIAYLDQKENRLTARDDRIEQTEKTLRERSAEVDHTLQAEIKTLQEIAKFSCDAARRMLLEKMEIEVRAEGARLIQKIQEAALHDAEAHSRDLLTAAMERYAGDHVSQISTCRVAIPSEEMKGRIIGREGRNIRAIENETGCNILIDDTPGVVLISGFDPYRREIARLTVEKLIADGRIQPVRIEEIVAEVRADLTRIVVKAGEDALAQLQITGVAPDLIQTLGRLKFRHSYAQNVLQHSTEAAHIMGILASELGLDPAVAKRVGIFHDIGKALDHTIEGGHALIGADLLRRCGESAVVVNAVAAHHHDMHGDSAYAALASAADALTAARPGARSEATEGCLKRLEQLEAIARAHRGVKQSYALQAGRELRIFVIPERIEDHELLHLARAIGRQIEEQMKFPGQIKITVIRETRCVEYAK